MNNQQGEKYTAIAFSSVTAAPLIILTGRPIITFGGYSGNDHTLSIIDLENLVNSRQVKYFLFPISGLSKDITVWMRAQCKIVNPNLWQIRDNYGNYQKVLGPLGEVNLFICSGKNEK